MNKYSPVAFFLILYILTVGESCQPEMYVQGKRIYEVNCENCHMADGKGLGEMYPDISISSYFGANKDQLACLIRNGRQGSVMATIAMPGNKQINDIAMNNLVNYLSYTWGDKSTSNINDLKNQLENCEKSSN
jgi:mono/diheme cytochrome c family protein